MPELTYLVAKPFPHPLRRFVPGSTVTAADVDGGPIPLDTLTARGFLEVPKAEVPKKGKATAEAGPVD